MRRTYGSRLFQLIDNPTNRETQVEIYAATAEALATWEPRISVDRVSVSVATPGHITLALQGTLVQNGQPITLDGIVI